MTSEAQLGHLAQLQLFVNSDPKERACSTLFLHFCFIGMKKWRKWGTDPYKGARLQLGEVSGQRFVSGEKQSLFWETWQLRREERGWWCRGMWRQAPCWQGRARSACTPMQPSIMLRPHEHCQQPGPDRGGSWCNGHRCSAGTGAGSRALHT